MNLQNKSWRTSSLGVLAIVCGIRLGALLYVPANTIWFNLVYVLRGPELFIIVGIGLIHARDHSCGELPPWAGIELFPNLFRLAVVILFLATGFAAFEIMQANDIKQAILHQQEQAQAKTARLKEQAERDEFMLFQMDVSALKYKNTLHALNDSLNSVKQAVRTNSVLQ